MKMAEDVVHLIVNEIISSSNDDRLTEFGNRVERELPRSYKLDGDWHEGLQAVNGYLNVWIVRMRKDGKCNSSDVSKIRDLLNNFVEEPYIEDWARDVAIAITPIITRDFS